MTIRTGGLLTMLLALGLASCQRDQEPTTARAPGDSGSGEAATANAGSAQPMAEAASVRISSNDSYEANFNGLAYEFMQHHAKPATPDLADRAKTVVESTARLEGCKALAGQSDAYLADLDGDGTDEGLAIYAMGACQGAPPQVMTRILVILRQDDDAEWVPVLENAISVLRGSERRIIEIAEGRITLSPEADGEGGFVEPEVIEIPEIPTPETAE